MSTRITTPIWVKLLVGREAGEVVEMRRDAAENGLSSGMMLEATPEQIEAAKKHLPIPEGELKEQTGPEEVGPESNDALLMEAASEEIEEIEEEAPEKKKKKKKKGK